MIHIKNTILVVEDNISISNTLKALFEMNNLHAVFADTGKVAYEILNETKIDLILSDLLLPDINGTEILLFIKNNEQTKYIPFVILSAFADPVDIKKCMNMGADDYITKPFLSKTLLNSIHKLLNKKNDMMNDNK